MHSALGDWSSTHSIEPRSRVRSRVCACMWHGVMSDMTCGLRMCMCVRASVCLCVCVCVSVARHGRVARVWCEDVSRVFVDGVAVRCSLYGFTCGDQHCRTVRRMVPGSRGTVLYKKLDGLIKNEVLQVQPKAVLPTQYSVERVP